MQGCLVAAAGLQEIVLESQVAGQLAGGHDGLIGNNLVTGTIGTDTNDGAILHGMASQVAHALACSLGIEILTFEAREHLAYLNGRDKSGKRCPLCICKLCDINGNIAAVTLGPTILPKVTGNLGYLVDDRL